MNIENHVYESNQAPEGIEIDLELICRLCLEKTDVLLSVIWEGVRRTMCPECSTLNEAV